MCMQSAPHFTPRLVMVASKMHELASSVDISKPAAQAKPQNALAAYNQSKLAQVCTYCFLLNMCTCDERTRGNQQLEA